MFRRKLIAVFGVVALLAVTAGVSQGSLSRVEGMALNVPVLSQFTDDYVNIYYYPTSVVRQNNLVLAELGNNPDGDTNDTVFGEQSFTVIKNWPELGSIAFQMKQSALNTPGTSGGVVSDNLNNEQLDIIWGRGFDKLDLAVRLDITNSRLETSTSTGGITTTSEFKGFSSFDPFFGVYPFGVRQPDLLAGSLIELNTWGITPAITVHMADENRLEAAATYRRFSLDRSTSTTGAPPGEEFKDAGNASYALLARWIMNQGDRNTWYWAGWYLNNDLGYEVTASSFTPTDFSVDETYKSYGVGVGNNMRVNDSNLLLWGATIWEEKHDYEREDANTGGPTTDESSAEDKITMIPTVFAAIETQATSWLKVRIGANRSLVSGRSEVTDFGTPATTTVDESRTSSFNFSLGAGIRWNNLDLDWTMNEAFPLSGGWILSGDEETPATRASATYHF